MSNIDAISAELKQLCAAEGCYFISMEDIGNKNEAVWAFRIGAVASNGSTVNAVFCSVNPNEALKCAIAATKFRLARWEETLKGYAAKEQQRAAQASKNEAKKLSNITVDDL